MGIGSEIDRMVMSVGRGMGTGMESEKADEPFVGKGASTRTGDESIKKNYRVVSEGGY